MLVASTGSPLIEKPLESWSFQLINTSTSEHKVLRTLHCLFYDGPCYRVHFCKHTHTSKQTHAHAHTYTHMHSNMHTRLNLKPHVLPGSHYSSLQGPALCPYLSVGSMFNNRSVWANCQVRSAVCAHKLKRV